MGAEILQTALPEGQAAVAAARLPALRPVDGPWLTMDDAYGAQVGARRRLLNERPADVIAQLDGGLEAAVECAQVVLDALPAGFSRVGDVVGCPDGVSVTIDWADPLRALGAILQQDVCILERRGAEHVMTGAVLCFPASWTLRQKIGKPLTAIHEPIDEYDDNIAKRVQRMFDGIKEGRPMWRANLLRYEDPTLFQPRIEGDPRPVGQDASRYLRSERQTLVRLPATLSVAFVIHTSVVRAS